MGLQGLLVLIDRLYQPQNLRYKIPGISKKDELARQFFYMPLMHSESLTDQDRAVRLILTRLPNVKATQLPHAQAHREIIREFGRFPARNEALSRRATAPEKSYQLSGGYRMTLEAVSKAF